jgi:carboxylate-amine ligase
VISHRFGRAASWALGIEEEVVLVDAETFGTTPAFSRVVGEATEELKPEVFECLVELATPVVPDAGAALGELRRLRGELAARAASHGILVHAAGAHALAHGEGQPLVPIERYERMAAKLGDRLYRQLVCGLHVHVSIPDPQTCLAVFEALVPWLPVLLALSANSPLAEGEDTGRRSERAERLLLMPTGGTPPVLGSWDDWAAASRGDKNRRHWDAWPRPEYGTLEVRVTDTQTDARRSAGLAAIVQALVVRLQGQSSGLSLPYDRDVYTRRRAEAAAGPPVAADVEALATLIDSSLNPRDRHLAEAVLDGRPEAERQLDVAAAEGIAAVPRDVVERTAASLDA